MTMLSLASEADLKDAWRLIERHAGSQQLVSRIARACPSVRLLGSGPFGWIDLKQRTEVLGMKAGKWEDLARFSGPVLVGEFGWTESQLVECVLSYRARKLQLTCQQDLVYELLVVVAPEEINEVHAKEIADIKAAHPALRWIATRFGWARVCNQQVPANLVPPTPPSPTTAVTARTSGWVQPPRFADAVMPSEGVLQASGYSVGRSGLPLHERRRALCTVMEEELPPGFHPAYAAQWGKPWTDLRLRKTAETLAALARNAKRRTASMDVAIEHWESDLKWLRHEYPALAQRIPWPSCEVE